MLNLQPATVLRCSRNSFDSFGIFNFFNFDILDFQYISWFVPLKMERLQLSGSGTCFAFLTHAAGREPRDHKEGDGP